MTPEGPHGRGGRRLAARAALVVLLLCALTAGPASGSGITNAGNDLRDGWYGNQPDLGPGLVGGATFGQLWSATVDGQIYAQPLVHAGRVIAATERNQVVSLDSETGAPAWTVTLPHGIPWQPKDIGCGDLTPDIGVTATPVIDPATNTVYLTHKTYISGSSGPAAWWMDALDAATGAERPGFPVALGGTAQNAPAQQFDPTYELQRPGLLLLGGAVYAAFGGHCDLGNYQGWVFGVDAVGGAAPGTVRARWTSVTIDVGGGIWQSGAGLMSDGPGRIFLATGNGSVPGPQPSNTPGGLLGESVVRLDVQPDGTLRAGDFFAPYDAAWLNSWDADFASGGVTGLRDDVFGNAAHPHIAVTVGKSGYVYLLDRDALGGFAMGKNGADRVLQRIGPFGGVWSRPAVWPGSGGWVAIPTATTVQDSGGAAGYLKIYRFGRTAAGDPSLSPAGTSADAFGFGSSAPVVTSDGTTPGSALLWTVWMPDGSGKGAELRAYDPVPQAQVPRLVFQAPVGQGSKFTPPGVGSGRIYVGTRDGHVLGFGAPVNPDLRASSTPFPTTTVGTSSTATVTLTASGHLTVSAVSAGAPFAADTSTLGLPRVLDAGDTLPVPVTFTPPSSGLKAASLTVTTDKGSFSFGLNGSAQAPGPKLSASPPAVSFGGAVVGSVQTDTMTLGNSGGQDVVIATVQAPPVDSPFAVDGLPQPGDRIAPGAAIDYAVHFAPLAPGPFADEVVVTTQDGQSQTVGLSGTAGTGGQLTLAPAGGLDFGGVPVGQSADAALTLANNGDTRLTIMKSKPPAGGAFAALDALDEGSSLAPGATRTVRVRFSPQQEGPASGAWIITASDGQGQQTVRLTGAGTVVSSAPPAPASAAAPAPAPQAPPALASLAPGPIGPDLLAQAAPPAAARLRAGLAVTAATASPGGRRLAIGVRAAAPASGRLTVAVDARLAGRTVRVTTTRRLRGGTLVLHVDLPRGAGAWRSLRVTARFPGSDRVGPATASLVVVRGR